MDQYISPEIMDLFEDNKKKIRIDPFSCDIYSLGAIFFEWICGSDAIKKLNDAKISNS